jgi:hypothetical protein
VGLSGEGGSLPEIAFAKKEGLKSLNKIELWFLGPCIEVEKRIHRQAFRSACIEVLGEDPEEDWI